MVEFQPKTKTFTLDEIDENVRGAWASAMLIVVEIMGHYPEDIFVPPVKGTISSPDAYSAAGARHACRQAHDLMEKAKTAHLRLLEDTP